MERIILTQEEAQLFLQNQMNERNAQVFLAGTQKPFSVQVITLDLTSARLDTAPFKIGFPFRSLWIQSATDAVANVNVKIGSQDSFQSVFSMKLNDVFELNEPTSEAYLHWSAQASKSVTIIAFTNAIFRPGSQLSSISGTVSTSETPTTTLTLPTPVTLVAATAAAIAPALTTRRVATLQNVTGADIYIGDSTVTNAGATLGIKIPPDGIIIHKSAAALYGYSVAGGVVIRTEEA